MTSKNLSSEHTYILRLLEHGAMDIGTLVRASFGTSANIQKILDDLVSMNLVERYWNGEGFVYKKLQ
jgi:DNA-binding MarR family transcriptional regulator